MLKGLQKTRGLFFVVLCCSLFSTILSCVYKEITLPERSSINYYSQGYLEVCIGPYKLFLPQRFEDQYKLISKINSKTSKESFKGEFYIDIPNKKFFLGAKDYHLFALTEQPIVDKHEYPGEETIKEPSPNSWDKKFYLNDTDFWQLNLKYDAYLWNFWLYKNGKYVLKISFDSRFKPTKKEIQLILASISQVK